ncbi:hypothetical protein B0I31_10342 [Saccharothrix carnea]|uniref:Lipoprotein n=1 Tax=Saccharothrix carnea TaxID=1280637 RepID=A0A2P8ICV6_SACCR|nr:hypothetical protein [Saccharothrix carnea]PSL56293.1 hypothetical protein B0I31_10342 [Saccharothrix carnea]
MRNVKAAVALALLALAGCTGTTTDNPPLGQSSVTTTTTTGSTSAPTTLSSTGEPQPTAPPPQTTPAPLEGGPTEVPAARIDGSTLPDTYEKKASTSADGRTVQVLGLAGGCKTASAEVAAQSGDQVLITLVTTHYPPPTGVLCTQELRSVPLNVTLDAPLGSRRIVLEAREETA